MKKIIFLLMITANISFAQSFSGCGTYVFNGILKEDPKAKNKISYFVNEGSKSQMIFEIPNTDDLSELIALLNTSSTFEGKITKLMDGTKGEVKSPTKIGKRFPDPLNSQSTGIKKISDGKCD